MKITNKFNLPQTFVNVLVNDDYTREGAHLSVTQLIDSPRIRVLREKHDNEIERDVSESVFMIFGKACHHVMERGADELHIAEDRLHAVVDNWRISGGVDVQFYKTESGGIGIADYKVTSSYAAMNLKEEWKAQLNCYAWLWDLPEPESKAEELEIWAIIRDWNRHSARQNKNYPETPLVRIPVELWDFRDRQAYIESRVADHEAAGEAAFFGDELPLCTDEERWLRGETKYQVWKEGGKKPSRVFDVSDAAERWIGDRDNIYSIVEHRSEPVRCMEFCEVADFCTQHQEYLKNQKEGK